MSPLKDGVRVVVQVQIWERAAEEMHQMVYGEPGNPQGTFRIGAEIENITQEGEGNLTTLIRTMEEAVEQLRSLVR